MTNARILDSRTTGESSDGRIAVKRVDVTPAQQGMVDASVRDLMAGYPFLASLASSDSLYYHAVVTDKFPVAAVDGVALYLNTAEKGWFDPKKWEADHRVFAHAHEILHIMREDCIMLAVCNYQGSVAVPRTPTCPDGRLPFKEEVFAKATDAGINSALIEDLVGKPLPGVYTHPAITWATPLGEAYAICWEEDQKQPPQQGNGPSNPNGPGKPPPGGGDPLQGDQQAPGDMGDPEGDSSDDASQPQSPMEAIQRAQEGAAEREVAVQRAMSAARQAGTGTSCVEKMVKKAREPGVDWRSYIQGFLARAAGNSAYNFQRPARPPLVRELMGEVPFFSPSRAGHGCNTIVYVGDTSGSIQEPEHRVILAAGVELMRDLNPKNLIIMWVDTKVQRIDTFMGAPGADALEDFYNRNPIPRGGGTDFCPPFDLIESLRAGGTAGIPAGTPSHIYADLQEVGKPDGLVYVTDLEGGAPDNAPDYPVLWVSVQAGIAHPWGERVTIDPAELNA